MIDRTLDLVRTGYPWAARLRGGAPAVATRVLGRPAVVVGGPEGVRRFYDPRLRRRGAVPAAIALMLFGPGTVHGIDDAEHHLRKALFLGVITPDTVAALGERADAEWAAVVRGSGPLVVFDEAVRVQAAAVLPWAGVPVSPGEAARRGRQLATVVDGFGKPGPAYARAVRARLAVGHWTRRLIRDTRRGRIRPPEGTALYAAARARSGTGALLAEREAATTLLNVIRPTVAVAWFVAFAAKALAEHPRWRERIAGGEPGTLGAFVHEVRRLYPFVPVLAARARHDQDVLGVPLRRGGLVLLDVHGTDHDPEHWPDSGCFDPERFRSGVIDPDTLVPQGGGDLATGHRCPGETVLLRMVESATLALAGLPAQSSPDQDWSYDLAAIPTRPRRGVVARR